MKRSILSNTLLVFLFSISALLVGSDANAQKKPGGQKAGGVQKPAARPAAQSAGAQKAAPRPAANSTKSAQSNVGDRRDRDDRFDGNKNDHGGINNNNVNIDKSRGDVNINVDNSKDIKINNNRNTVVRRNTYRPYTRPPYVYGGYRYRCYHPYYYHPYRPFVWGPVWHPWGFFVMTIATTAIIVSFADADLPAEINNYQFFAFADGQENIKQSGPAWSTYSTGTDDPVLKSAAGEYYYDQGVFYLKEKEGYTVVAAPVGGVVKSLPEGYETVVIDETKGVKNYYWGGTFYEKISNGYKVVPPTSGAVVEHISDGGEEVKMGDVTYVKLGETYYQPIQLNGKNVYEVVDVEADK